MANSPARNRVLPKLPGFLDLDAGEGIVQKTRFHAGELRKRSVIRRVAIAIPLLLENR